MSWHRPLSPRALGLLVVLGLVVAGGFMLFPLLPHQDLPAHAGLLAVRQRLESSALLGQHFQQGALLGPYTSFLALAQLLGAGFGADVGMRMLAAIATLALPAALLVARHRVVGDGWVGAGYLGLVLALGFPAALGLMSFLLGQAALVLAVAQLSRVMFPATAPSIAHGAHGTDGTDGQGPFADPGASAAWRAEALLALLALATALSHGFSFVLLALIAVISLRAPGSPRGAWIHLRALAPAGAALVAAALRDRGFYPAGPERSLIHYDGLLSKLALLVLPATSTRLLVDALIGLALSLLLGVGVWIGLRRAGATGPGPILPSMRRRAALARAAVILGAMALLAPTRVGWFGSIDLRLAMTALLLAILALPPVPHGRRRRGWMDLVAPWMAVGVAACSLVATAAFQFEARAARAVLSDVPAGSRLLYLPVDPTSRYWAARPFLHWDHLLLLDRDVLISDPWLHAGSALRTTPAAAWLSRPIPPFRQEAQRAIDWAAIDLAPWDHVLVRTFPGTTSPLVPEQLRPVAGGRRAATLRSQVSPQAEPEHHGHQQVGQRGRQGDAGQAQR